MPTASSRRAGLADLMRHLFLALIPAIFLAQLAEFVLACFMRYILQVAGRTLYSTADVERNEPIDDSSHEI